MFVDMHVSMLCVLSVCTSATQKPFCLSASLHERKSSLFVLSTCQEVIATVSRSNPLLAVAAAAVVAAA